MHKIEMDDDKQEDSVIFMFIVIVKSNTMENYEF